MEIARTIGLNTAALAPSVPTAPVSDEGNLLDEVKGWQAFSYEFKPSDYSSSTSCWRSQLKVQGFYCAACAGTLEQALRKVPGVFAVQVDAVSARVIVSWDSGQTRPSAWLQAASKAGYPLLPIAGFDALAGAKQEARTLFWRWLVAGFCMMQIMMYAWPNYTALPGEIDPLSDQLLRWASWLLALPILLFSCRPFFAGAWRSLKHRRIAMDLPVSIGIIITFFVSSVAVWQPTGPWGSELYLDSLAMLVFFLLTGRWIEARLRAKVGGDLELSASQIPLFAQKRNALGEFETVPVVDLTVNDEILIRFIAAYMVLGAFAGGLVKGVAWASQFVTVFKPIWAMLHALMLVWGLILLVYATQPIWASRVTAPVQRRIVWANQSPWRSSLIGFHWLVLPCGLLYSALLLAGLSSSAWQGALVMLAFVLPTIGWLASAQWLVQLQAFKSPVTQARLRRVVGLMLALGSGWSLWHHASQGFKALC